MKEFEYIPANSLSEAVEILAREGERARLLAGGTDLITRIRMGREEAPDYLVSLRQLQELNYLTFGQDGSLHLGALATLHSVEADPRVTKNFAALAEAAASVGSLQVRNIGTVVGNVCSASSAADAAVALLALGATARVIGPQGEREVGLAGLFAGPRQTSLGRGEMVKEVFVPAPRSRTGQVFLRVSPRRAMDCSVAAVAATVTLGEDGRIEEARIGLGAVAPTPKRASAAESILKGNAPTGEILKAAGDAAARGCEPISDIRGSMEYRREMVRVMTVRAVAEASRRASHQRGVRR